MNLESCAFTLNKCLVIGQNLIIKKIYVFSHLEPLNLRCELIFMPEFPGLKTMALSMGHIQGHFYYYLAYQKKRKIENQPKRPMIKQV